MDLAACASIDAVLAAARTRDLAPITPRARVGADGAFSLLLPGDPLYERASEPCEEPPPERQRRFLLEGARWVVRR
jgi:hypothetical protein